MSNLDELLGSLEKNLFAIEESGNEYTISSWLLLEPILKSIKELQNNEKDSSFLKEKEEDEMEESSPKKKKSKLNYYENDNFQSKFFALGNFKYKTCTVGH